MRNFTKSLLALALMFVCVGGAKAEVKTDWDPSDAFSTTWTAATNTLSWNKNWANVLYTGFAPKTNGNTTEVDLSKYAKIHYKITSLTGTASDGDGAYIDLKVRSTGKDDLTIKLRQGEHDILFADYATTIDFAKILELTISATYADGAVDGDPGSAVIPEMYLYTDRWEIQTQYNTEYSYSLGTALSLSSVVSESKLVSIASGSEILYGKANDGSEWGSNQIKSLAFDNAMALVEDDDNTSYQFRIIDATTEVSPLPSGVTTIYRIKAFKKDGTTPFTGPGWNGGNSFYLQEISWTYNVADGTSTDDASFFAITAVPEKENIYKISAYKKNGTAGYKEVIYNKSEWFFNVMAKTPHQVAHQVWVEVQGADTEDPGVPAVPDGWVSLITNGDLSGNDVTSFWTKNEDGGAIAAVINESAGRMNGRGIKVTTKDEAGTDWGTQFFIKSSEPLKEGQKLHIEFDYRADRPQEAATQVHRNPGDYNANIDAINFTVNWKHYSNEITITSAMCKQDGGTGDFYLQSFGMNLSHIRSTSNFYFDNIVMWTEDDPLKPQKIALQNAIDKGNLQNSFAKTTDSWNDLQTTISNGVAELANASTTAELLTNAADAINNAIVGLKLQDGYTNLTADMLRKWDNNNTPTTSTAVSGAYVLNESTGQPYGESTVNYLNFADISDFSKLYLLIAEGAARIQMNRETDGGTTHIVTSNNAVTEVDFATEPQLAGFDFVHLNAIKDNWGGVTVTGMYLYRTVTVTTAGFASFGSLFKNAQLKGTTTYAAKYSAGKLTLTEVTNVPAGKGVIVEAAAGSYPPTFDVAAEDIDSDLKVSNGTVVGDGSQFFALAKKDDKVGFAKVKSGVKIPAGKAYLFVEGGCARDFIGFDDETTGIEAVEQATKTDNQYFNLAGQRVAQPTKGLYIVNGKKVIIK